MRPLVAVLLLALLAVVGGALLVPHVFNGLLLLGRAYSPLGVLRDVEFERVLTRTIMLLALAGVFPALRYCRMAGWVELGFSGRTRWRASFWTGWWFGCLSMSVLFVLGLLMGAFTPYGGWAVKLLSGALPLFVAAALIGLFEELFCRGALFGMLRRSIGLWGAATLSSLFYSLVHFVRPDPPLAVLNARWDSGLSLLQHSFGLLGPSHTSFPMILTLFVIGFILCILYERQGHLYTAIGLHAGWVWVIQMGTHLFKREPERLTALFGPSILVSKSYMALLVSLVFLAVLLVYRVVRPVKVPAAQGEVHGSG